MIFQDIKDIPVLVIFFNRPETLKQVLLSLKKIKPKSVYFAYDGPRINHLDDALKVNQCLDIIANLCSWESKKNFLSSNDNLGCDLMVPSAISWFFSHVESGIILEDDCIVSESFFIFALNVLNKYKNVEKIMNVSAANFQIHPWGDADYYFSLYPTNWAWATWARAWEKFDPDMKEWNRGGHSWLSNLLKDKRQYKYWVRFFNGLVSKKYTYWDAKWVYSIWISGGLSITPNFNLVSNIGFGKDATHTKSISKGMAALIDKVDLPLKHPDLGFEVSYEADKFLYETRYKPTTIGYTRHFLRKLGQYVK